MKIGSAKVVTWSGAQYPGGYLVRCSISRWLPGHLLNIQVATWQVAQVGVDSRSVAGSGAMSSRWLQAWLRCAASNSPQGREAPHRTWCRGSNFVTWRWSWLLRWVLGVGITSVRDGSRLVWRRTRMGRDRRGDANQE